MSDALPYAPARPGVAHQWATRIAFFLAGICMSAWAPLVPFAKARVGLSEGHLGLLLLSLGAGSVVGMPLASGWAAKFGCRTVIVASAVTAVFMLPVLATATHPAVMAAALLVFGASIGTLDVTMNIQAVIVERESDRPMMSGFHGMYSVGGIAGAGVVVGLASLGLPPVGAVAGVMLPGLLLLAISFPALLPYGGDPDAPAFALPRGRVLVLGVFCFVLFLAEGSVLDWSAVFLSSARGMADSHAGLGYLAFSVAMTVCRLTGDIIVRHVGARRVVLLGTACAAAGFVLAVTVPSAAVSVVGFGLVGVGASNVVPVMFTAAGRQTAMPAGLAIAAITTLGYAGILLGPAMIGALAHHVGLPLGMAFVSGLLLAVMGVSTRVRL